MRSPSHSQVDENVIDWRIVVLRPLGLIVLTIPLFVALGHLTLPAPDPPGTAQSWRDPLERAHHALAEGDIEEAVRTSQLAYHAALGSRQWSSMIEVGDLYVRVGERTHERGAMTARARAAYVTALLRARREGALEGVLRAAESFSGLGDHDATEHSLRIAASLGDQGSTEARAMYRAAAERLRAPAQDPGY
jgi:hypothetical protein